MDIKEPSLRNKSISRKKKIENKQIYGKKTIRIHENKIKRDNINEKCNKFTK
jgi:hypothetical protein